MPLLIRWFLRLFLGLSLSLSFHLAFGPAFRNVWAASGSLATPSSPHKPTSTATTPHALVQAGKALYDNQRYVEANQQLKQAVHGYSLRSDRTHQAQTLALQSLVLQKLGQWDTAQAVLDQSHSLLKTLPSPPLRIRAQVFNTQGHLQFLTGEAAYAIASWESAEQDYLAEGELTGAIGSQINQMQTLESLGLYHLANQRLNQIEAQLPTLSDDAINVRARLSLGNVLRLQGEVAQAQSHLKTGLAIAQTLPPSPITTQLIGQLYLNLGNTEQLAAARAVALNTVTTAQTHTQLALDYYQQAAATASLPLTQIEAQLNQLSLLIQQQTVGQTVAQTVGQTVAQTVRQTSISELHSLISSVDQSLPALIPSRGAVYAQINFAHSLMKLDAQQRRSLGVSLPDLLADAIEQAESLGDERAIAYAIGTLGRWHETQEEWDIAKHFTEIALQKAQSIRASDIAYQWQWQMGRLLKAEADQGSIGKSTLAIRYYTGAVETLDTLRADLVALNPDVQFSFREQVEPVYRELVDLLLREENPSQETLLQALNVIESLQLAELDNFFRSACAQPQAVTVNTVDPNAAVIYPILLRDRLEVILQLPETTPSPSKEPRLFHVGHVLSNTDVVQAATTLQRDLRVASVPTSQIKTDAQQLYDWVIRPFEDKLDVTTKRDDSPIKTLSFVLDGPLRNLPMAILYDGDHYLVERYAIAVTPGLQLLDPQPLQRQPLNVLLAGAVDAPSFERFALGPLANVDRELEDIRLTIVETQRLKDQAFLQSNIQAKIETQPFNVIHLATHGQFSSNPEQTFILDWQQPILAKDIDRLLAVTDPQRAVKNPIELLVLSACETASGDSRAALGLAGIAIRAGARSTVATLWQVNDASTAEFMVRFYRELSNSQVTKAEALRNVQLSFLSADSRTRYPRPNRWAPFILVGNWL